MRPGRRLRVVLHAERPQIRRREPLARAVVQVHVRRAHARGERREIDAKTVVLRGDLDAPGGEILHGLIAAAMAELQLVRPAAEREAQELVPEADPEDRLLAD